MTDIQRDESFRSAIKNQKRRLSATKVEKRNSLTSETGYTRPNLLAGLKTRDSLTPPRRDGWTPPRGRNGTPATPPTPNRSTPVRTAEPLVADTDTPNGSHPSTPDIRLEFWNIEELSPLSTPATSPRHSPSPTPARGAQSRSPSPRPFASPLPPGSPLLSPSVPISPALKRARSFNKELRRARSFRALRDASCSNSRNSSRNASRAASRCGSPELEIENINPLPPPPAHQEVSFRIKRALGTRKGWKIMPEDGDALEGEALKKVVAMIKDIEFQGFAVPERITIKL